MGSRSTARRIAMQAVFQSEISGIDINEAISNLLEEEKISEETITFTTRLAVGVNDSRKELDKKIEENSKNWSIDRINMVNKSILRLAVFEMLHEKNTPRSVIINEALELAKRYSDEESAKFINGILDSIVV